MTPDMWLADLRDAVAARNRHHSFLGTGCNGRVKIELEQRQSGYFRFDVRFTVVFEAEDLVLDHCVYVNTEFQANRPFLQAPAAAWLVQRLHMVICRMRYRPQGYVKLGAVASDVTWPGDRMDLTTTDKQDRTGESQ